MPVNSRKKPRKTTKVPSTKASAAPTLCDGCSAAINDEEDALKCSVCSVQLHRYCAGIPQCHFEAIASNFVCLACSLSTSKIVVAELRNEIAALKAEVIELRSALDEEKKACKTVSAEIAILRRSEPASKPTEHPRRNYASAAKRSSQINAGPDNRASQKRPRHAAQHRQRSENATTPPNGAGESARANATASLPREEVSGARRVWGTLRSATCTSVKNTISHLTSVNNFQVKRKVSHSARSGKDKWWFILKGDEEAMKSLENAWEPVKLQTGWQLEPCTKPITPSTSSSNSPTSLMQIVAPEGTNPSATEDVNPTPNVSDSDSRHFLGEPQPSTQSPPISQSLN